MTFLAKVTIDVSEKGTPDQPSRIGTHVEAIGEGGFAQSAVEDALSRLLAPDSINRALLGMGPKDIPTAAGPSTGRKGR